MGQGTLKTSPVCPQTALSSSAASESSITSTTKTTSQEYGNFSDFWQQMSQELFLKKKEQNLQHQLLLQQQHQHSFPSPITPSPFDKKVFSSASSTPTRQEASSNGSSTNLALDVPTSSLFSTSASSTTPTPNSSLSSSSQRHNYIQNPFSDVYGSGGGFLSSSYAAAAAIGTSHHDLSRSSCFALPSPTIYPPTPPPSTHWVHPAWFGSLESAGYMKTPKSSNSFEN